MTNDLANIAQIGALIADPVRTAMLSALMDGSERAAGELAECAGASPQSASAHLGLLLDGGLLAVTARGRHRFYRLRDAEVAHALETLSLAAELARQKAGRVEPALRRARRCYDHIAGALGVAICDALILRGRVITGSEGLAISDAGRDWLYRIDLVPPSALRRSPVRPCLDWTERRPHLAGWLGAAICQRLESAGALRRKADSRALTVTPKGRAMLAESFAVDWSG